MLGVGACGRAFTNFLFFQVNSYLLVFFISLFFVFTPFLNSFSK